MAAAIPSTDQRTATSPARRSQLERRTATRAALLRSAVELIVEQGNADLRLTEVASHAGVTKGAIQHHFATKNDLLAAVVLDGWSDLTTRLDGYAPGDSSIEERIVRLVELMWQSYSRPAALAAYTIVATINDAPELIAQHLTAFDDARTTLDRQWGAAFADTEISTQQVQSARHFTRTYITGMLTHRRVESNPPNAAEELLLLQQAVLGFFAATPTDNTTDQERP
ncbi:MAG: TetR/AcrR family transcriptional regulator [Actinomycetota bacterium]